MEVKGVFFIILFFVSFVINMALYLAWKKERNKNRSYTTGGSSSEGFPASRKMFEKRGGK
jgi:Na+/proline symporter